MRTKQAYIRTTQPDAKYQSETVAKLIGYVMIDGKKTVAQKQVYGALEKLAQNQKKTPTDVLDDVIRSIAPQMEVRSRRVGGAAYQVPMPVRPRRASALALRWLVQEANKRANKEYHSFADKLAAEMQDALTGQGGAVGRRNTVHRMAEANKAFAHFRW